MNSNFFGILICIVFFGIGAFFVWANYYTRKVHAKFRQKDVEFALEEVLSDESCCHDCWDLFLAHRIDDTYLESLRQRCLEILRTCPPPQQGEDVSKEGLSQILGILNELKSREVMTQNIDKGCKT